MKPTVYVIETSSTGVRALAQDETVGYSSPPRWDTELFEKIHRKVPATNNEHHRTSASSLGIPYESVIIAAAKYVAFTAAFLIVFPYVIPPIAHNLATAFATL